VVDQLLLVHVRLRCTLDEGHRHLDQVGVLDADHRGDLDAGVAPEVRLDLGRRDVLAADLEHVLEPAGVADPPLGVEPAEVSGPEEPLLVGAAAGVLGVVEVAGEHPWSGQPDLAHLAGRALTPALGVDDPDPDTRERATGGGEPQPVGVVKVTEGDDARPR
jgi:hypothetical protein